jgi:hypothetical protein
MATFRHEQHNVTHRGRTFHFVSYEATDANPARQVEALPDTWFLVSSGHRWPAVPHVPDLAAPELDAQLIAWLERVVFAEARPA